MKHRKRELLHNQRPHLLSSKLAGRLMSAMPMQGANQCNAHPKLLVRATEKSLAFSQIPSGWLPSQPPSRLYGFLVSTSASVQTETNCLLLQPLQWRELWLKRTPSAPKSLAPRHRRKKNRLEKFMIHFWFSQLPFPSSFAQPLVLSIGCDKAAVVNVISGNVFQDSATSEFAEVLFSW